jgi:hypothetical protein
LMILESAGMNFAKRGGGDEKNSLGEMMHKNPDHRPKGCYQQKRD